MHHLPLIIRQAAGFTGETLGFIAFMLALCTPVLLGAAATGGL